MKITYIPIENIQEAHKKSVDYGAIIGYEFNSESNQFGLINWGFARDLVSARKTSNILEEMMIERLKKN